MSIVRIFGNAVRTTNRSLALVCVVYLVNAVLAGIVALAFQSTLSSMPTTASLAPLLADFDIDIFADFMRARGDAITALTQVAFFLTLLSMLLNSVLTGGILAHLRGNGRFSFRVFLAACGHYAIRCLRLLLLMGILLILAGSVLLIISSAVIGAANRNAVSENGYIIWGIGATTVAVASIVSLLMIGDYARIAMVESDGRSVTRMLWASFRFVIRNFPGAALLQIIMMTVAAGLALLYVLIEPAFIATSSLLVGVLFIVQQVFMFVRAWSRVMVYAGEVGFFADRRTRQNPEAGESAATLAGA